MSRTKIVIGSKVKVTCPHGKGHLAVVDSITESGGFTLRLVDNRKLCRQCRREGSSIEIALSE